MTVEEDAQSLSALKRAKLSSDASGWSLKEFNAGRGVGPLKWKTVNVYNTTIAELYYY
jgi:hypothetical protein